MPRATPMQNAFNSGELSYHIEGRTDIPKYASGCSLLENYLPIIQGPIKRRGGTAFVAATKDSSKRSWLMPFEFSSTQAYILEFGENYIRFYTQQSQLLSAGVPYEIASPYTAADLINSDGSFNLGFVQSNDIVYLSHQNYPLKKLSRIAPTNWVISDVVLTGGPFKSINSTATTVTSTGITGAVTLTASAAIFNISHIGSSFYIQQPLVSITQQWEPAKVIAINDLRRSNGITYKAINAATTGTIKPIHTEGTISDGAVNWAYQDPGYGYCTITGFTSTTVVSATVVAQLPSNATSATTKWAFQALSAVEGYATQCAFYKERLVLSKGQNIWLSVSGDYDNFNSKDPSGNVVTDAAISLPLQSNKVNSIQWLMSSDSLICGATGGEFSIQSITTNLAFGPDNVTAPSISKFGVKSLLPVQVGNVILFVQRAGSKLRDIAYEFVSNQFDSKDNSILADGITLGGIIQLAYQQEPYSMVWAVRSDGRLISMTYSREQYQEAPYGGWHNHPIAGIYNDGLFNNPAAVESIAVIPSPNCQRDDLWMIVKRTINGVTKRYVEYMKAERYFNDDPYSSFYVDSGLTLDRSAYNLVYAATGSTSNASAAQLFLNADALTAGSTNCVFSSGWAIFSVGDVGRYITFRYSKISELDGKTKIWYKAVALITAYVSTIQVKCTIIQPWPYLYSLAIDWRITTTTVTGLSSLEGQSVCILSEGAVQTNRVVTGGAITLDGPSGYANIGLSFKSRCRTMRFNAGGSDGTSQGKTSRINKLIIRFFESLGVSFGASFTALEEVPFRGTGDLMDEAPPLFTGDKPLDFTADYSTDPWVCIEQSDPLPATIISVIPVLSTQDRS
jgi:hypothetical protein